MVPAVSGDDFYGLPAPAFVDVQGHHMVQHVVVSGYAVEHVDLYRSDAENFVILEKTLIPPFTSLKGFGAVAAKAIISTRRNGRFTSVADLKKRAPSVTKANIELLRAHGCLEGMMESDQMELF